MYYEKTGCILFFIRNIDLLNYRCYYEPVQRRNNGVSSKTDGTLFCILGDKYGGI